MRTSAAEPWVSIDEVAAHLGVRRDSIYRWIERRGLPATKIGKLWKLKISEVDAWMQTRRGAGGSAEGSGGNALPAAPTRSILVVDDEELVRDTIGDFLGDHGYRVLTASDGDEALRLLAATAPPPDLIILDLKMPNLDGWEFRERQARDPKLAGIPVIVVSAVASAKVDAAAVLRKPLRLPQLASAIERLLAAG